MTPPDLFDSVLAMLYCFCFLLSWLWCISNGCCCVVFSRPLVESKLTHDSLSWLFHPMGLPSSLDSTSLICLPRCF
ncbi:hypothetical protein CXB51_007632 [Gossypium anomalum]|uniref:Uncharacterized protein n=1 Tax=Gossypium anomalum TaxID=47600 RepID=A0A8J5YUM6_9ROSI|nr:hypothetical protein CXB51_007632 [Gossypium anomalum]